MDKRHQPEEIIGKLREAEIVLAQSGTTDDACRRISVNEQTYYRWRKDYGGLKTDQARRMKDLEKKILRLGRASFSVPLKVKSPCRVHEPSLFRLYRHRSRTGVHRKTGPRVRTH